MTDTQPTTDKLNLTLITVNGDRLEPSREVEAQADEPRSVWPHAVDMALDHSLEEGFLVEVACDQRVLYELRCV